MENKAQVHDGLQDVLNPGTLEDVRRFWFRHIAGDDHIIVPDQQEALVWFSQNDGYDQECIAKFGTLLEYLRSRKVSAREILDAAQPKSPSEWMSLIILLDQLPRNCYRGEKAGLAYRFFDPLVLEIAYQAIAAGIPDRSEVRYRHGYRFWFYLPLEHSESMDTLKRVVKEHDKMFGDSRELMNRPTGSREVEV